MKLNRRQLLAFPGASLDWGDEHYLIRLEQPLQFLSSAPLGGGLVDARWVFSRQVDGKDCLPNPKEYLRQQARQFGVPDGQTFVGLLTAVRHQDLQVYTVEEGGVTVTTLATVGVAEGSSPRQKHISSFGTLPGGVPEPTLTPGTINIVTLIDADIAN